MRRENHLRRVLPAPSARYGQSLIRSRAIAARFTFGLLLGILLGVLLPSALTTRAADSDKATSEAAVDRTEAHSGAGADTGTEAVQGLQISFRELDAIGELARLGAQPHQGNVDELLLIAERGWTHGKVGSRFEGRISGDDTYAKRCAQVSRLDEELVLPDVGQTLYALVLAHVLTRDESFAREARSVLLDFTDSSGFDTVEGEKRYDGSNQCALDVSLLVPSLIDSALLLEAYPGWSVADKRDLQSWLGKKVYPLTAAIARTRKNNWGTAAAFASWSIGHYLSDSVMTLEEVMPLPRSLTPAQAMQAHLQSQLRIIGDDWRGDSACDVFGIQSHGGIPNELRRGSTGCKGTYLLDSDRAYAYQITTTSHLIYHAEALSRQGNNLLYTLPAEDGEPLLLKAIIFVIANPKGKSHDWSATDLGVLRVANAFYDDPRLCAEIDKGHRFAEGRYLSFARLTRPLPCR